MQYSFIVIGNQLVEGLRLEEISSFYPQYRYYGTFPNEKKTIESILKLKPHLVFINIESEDNTNTITFSVLSEMFQYLKCVPYFIALHENNKFSLEAIQNGFSDYLITTEIHSLSLSLAKFEKKMPIPIQHSLCIRSYSDYQFLKFNDIVYLKADNNSTDFKMVTGKVITAYKTLKYYEETLPVNFVRVHKSYIVNIHYVSRILFSKSKCFLNFNEQIPFSSSYRSMVETILVQNGIEL